jgi:predicted kinase
VSERWKSVWSASAAWGQHAERLRRGGHTVVGATTTHTSVTSRLDQMASGSLALAPSG